LLSQELRNYDSVEHHSICLNALDSAKHYVDQNIQSDQYLSDLLGEGQINSDDLTLFYPQIGYESNDVGNIEYGIRFQLINGLQRPLSQLVTYQFHILDIGLNWNVRWKGSFDFEEQSKIMLGLQQGINHLYLLEQKIYSENHLVLDTESFVVDGNPNISVRLTQEQSNSSILTFKAKNTKSGNFSLINNFHFVPILNDSIVHSKIPKMFIYEMTNERDSPFIDLSNHFEPIKDLNMPKFPAGIHRLRVLISFDRDSWVDLKPTWLDGPAVVNKADNAWLGRILTDEIRISVSNNGAVELLN
jgi:hypothetical protein